MIKFSKKRFLIYKNFSSLKNYIIDDSIEILKSFDVFKFKSCLNLNFKLSNLLKNNFIFGKFYFPYNVFKIKNLLFFGNFNDLNNSLHLNIKNIGLDILIYKIIFFKINFKFIIFNFKFIYYIFILKNNKLKINFYNFKKKIKNNFNFIFYNIKFGFNIFKSDKNNFINFSIGKTYFNKEFLKINIIEFINFIKLNKPHFIKNKFLSKIYIYSTMGFSLKIFDKNI